MTLAVLTRCLAVALAIVVFSLMLSEYAHALRMPDFIRRAIEAQGKTNPDEVLAKIQHDAQVIPPDRWRCARSTGATRSARGRRAPGRRRHRRDVRGADGPLGRRARPDLI